MTAASETDSAIQKKSFVSGMTTLTYLNEELDDTMKVDKSLVEAGVLIKDVIEMK